MRYNEFDAAVIGGGIIAQSVAMELGKHGLRIAMIYPADHKGISATLAAGAMITAFGEVTEENDSELSIAKLKFRVEAQSVYPEWVANIEAESGERVFVSKGLFIIGNNQSRSDRARINRLRNALEIHERRFSAVDPAEIPGLDPHRGYEPHSAIFLPDDFSVDSRQLLHALETLNRAREHTTMIDAAARGLLEHAGSHWSVSTDSTRPVRARGVVLCAGAFVPEILGDELLRRMRLPTLYFAKGMGALVSGGPPFPFAVRTPNRSDACGVHVIPRANGRLYIGASTHYGHALAAARGVTPGELTAILGESTREINRSLRDTCVEDIRFGLRPVSEHNRPLLGRTQVPNIYLATGTFRTGILMAPLIAKIMAGEVTGCKAPHNPWSAESPFNAAERTWDNNSALLHLDRGLRAYYKAKDCASNSTGARHQFRTEALEHWDTYLSYVGEAADQRILNLIAEVRTTSNSEVAIDAKL